MGTSFSSVIIKKGNSVCVSVPEFISLGCPYCVRGTRTQPLICVGCSVQLVREVFLILHSFVVADTHLPRFEALAYVLPHFEELTDVVIRASSSVF